MLLDEGSFQEFSVLGMGLVFGLLSLPGPADAGVAHGQGNDPGCAGRAQQNQRLSGGKVNPLIGAAGISAFPMAARLVQRMAHQEDFENFQLMHAMGANAAGQIASVVPGGVLLALMGAGGH